MDNNIAIFILTHGRANNVLTYKTIKKTNYTGKIYFIVDDADEQIELYKKNFGADKVIVFNKLKVLKEIKFDLIDNVKNFRTIIFARNACFNIAKELGIRYFMQLDDDYTGFYYIKPERHKLKHIQITKFNEVLQIMLTFFKNTNFKSIAMAQGGDFLGGNKGGFLKSRKRKRKCMNSFLCDVQRPFKFIGRINEDVNTYVNGARNGSLFLTIPRLCLVQKQTQSNKGGMSGAYEDLGTYVKSYPTVMLSPSSVRIRLMGSKCRRIHHYVDPNTTYQEIIKLNIWKEKSQPMA
jgi:hypothetical protein